LAPQHVSIYLLEVDEGSRLGNEILRGGSKYSATSVPTDDAMAEFYDLARTLLAQAGYEHYEISNFAKPGFTSEHNRKYWRREPYLGFGAGAHSFSGNHRWANARDAAAYVQAGLPPAGRRSKSWSNLRLAGARGRTLPCLRQLKGIDLDRLNQRYGGSVAERFTSLESSGPHRA
jgi:oxygen-independent coproporphyrinogen-3 oxidase